MDDWTRDHLIGIGLDVLGIVVFFLAILGLVVSVSWLVRRLAGAS